MGVTFYECKICKDCYNSENFVLCKCCLEFIYDDGPVCDDCFDNNDSFDDNKVICGRNQVNMCSSCILGKGQNAPLNTKIKQKNWNKAIEEHIEQYYTKAKRIAAL